MNMSMTCPPRHATYVGEWYGAAGTYFRTIPYGERHPMTVPR